MTGETNSGVTRKIVDFLNGIGIEVAAARLEAGTFLPGIRVENGKILFDEDKLAYPGDLLHEAGHLALASSAERPSLSGEVALAGVRMEPVEVSAMAWSYAAIIHIGLDPTVVFHEGGYGGESERLLTNFTLGIYIGVSGLVDAGLTVTGDAASASGIPPYPHMVKWLRD